MCWKPASYEVYAFIDGLSRAALLEHIAWLDSNEYYWFILEFKE